jgi:hypothetical protein
MQHYSLEEWADFARDVAEQGKKAAMQSHLETGCRKCTKVYGLWRRVNEAARRESAYEPPETAVRTMKGLGVIHGTGKARKASSPLAELLFDSFRDPLLAGVRSVTSTARQLLYGAGKYRIDVRMEPEADSEKVAIVGQVLNAADPAKTSPPVPVILFKGNKILSVSQTNSFGEFHLDCDLHTDLKLHFRIPSEMEIWIPLVNPAREAAGMSPDSTDSIGVKKLIGKAAKSTRKKV